MKTRFEIPVSTLATALATALALALSMASPSAFAQKSAGGDSSDSGQFKLTFGRYFVRDNAASDGTDLNLRYRRDDTTWWGGLYDDHDFGNQARGGFDTRLKPWSGHDVAILPAVMAASGGFVGGSLIVEVGSPFYVQAGLGRTNLRPFVNLNFDPNDAVTLAVGYRPDAGGSYALTVIRDNRTGTGQQDVHLTGQWTPRPGEKLTLDLLHKSGQGDSGYVSATGFTATYDFRKWFTRVAWDPKQNFGSSDVLRWSVGLWF